MLHLNIVVYGSFDKTMTAIYVLSYSFFYYWYKYFVALNAHTLKTDLFAGMYNLATVWEEHKWYFF